MKLVGEGYEGTVTPQMAEALVSLQTAMNRTYAKLVKHSPSSNSLTKKERNELAFKAKVEEGSSVVKIDLGEFATTLLNGLASKMDGTQMTIAVISIAAIGGGVLAFRAFLKHREAMKSADLPTTLSEQETKRLTILASVLQRSPMLQQINSEFDEAKLDMVKAVGDAQTLTLQGETLTQAQANIIASTPRERARELQLNGNYRIERLDWTKEEEVRVSVFGLDESREFTAKLSTQSLTNESKELLKQAEWERLPVHLQINATELRGEVTTATIVGVDVQKVKLRSQGTPPAGA